MNKLLLLFFIFINLSNANENLSKISLQLHWKFQFEFAGFIAAKEKGFYKDIGLDVHLKEYNYGDNIIDKVLDGESNYGIYNSNILVDYINKKPIELISSFFKRSALVLITKPYIKTPLDLIGKNVMAATREDFNLNFDYTFSMNNMDINKLNLIPYTFNIEDFKNENIDAMTAFISDQPYKLDQLNIDYNIIDPSSYGIFNLQLELFTSKDEASKHRERTQKFKEASIKGWKYALNNPDEIIDIILKKYNTQNLTKDFLENEAKITQRLILPKMYDIGSIDTMFLHRQIDILAKQKISLNEKKDLIDNFIFYSKKQLNEKQNHQLTILFIKILPFIIIIILIVLYRQWLLKTYNSKLKKEVEKKTNEYKWKNIQLENSNENFAKLLNTVIEGILIFDEENNLIQFNDSAKKMLKYKHKKSIKLEQIIPEHIDLKIFTENDNFKPFEDNLNKLDNSSFPCLISAKTIKRDNEKLLIITIVDLTQIKLRDDFIQQQLKLAQMGELLSMIAHQWRQPLTAIATTSEGLKLKALLNDINNSEIIEISDDIYRFTDHLSQTINDFRDFYKDDKTKQISTLNEIVTKSLNIIEDSILDNNITLNKHLNSTTKIETLPREITQVLLSIIQNAQDALIYKNINNAKIDIKTYEKGLNLIIEINDNAGGIKDVIMPKIFDPYFSTKKEKNGTGLGLYFAKRIIENNCKGILKVKNNEEGASFSIILPYEI